jgi:hypothetical protein
MSAKVSQPSTISIRRDLKVAILIIGVCTLILILAAGIVSLSEGPDLFLFINYFSNIRVTPAWPQIGSFPTLAP